MHPNRSFRKTAQTLSLDFARSRAFGTLVLSAEPAPLLAHVPFLLDKAGHSADLHLVRANPICRACGDGVTARLSVAGPDGYISPDWYGAADQVPTWNYVAVQLTGHLEPLPQQDLRDLLARLSAHFETALAPKPPWTMGKMTPEVLDRMLTAIRPFRLRIEDVQSTWKLGQNKPEPARLAAADHVTGGTGHDLEDLAHWMRHPPDPA